MKENISASVDKKVKKEFMENARKLEGPPFGAGSRGLEQAMRVFNNYFKDIDNNQLIKISHELGVPPWRVGAILINFAIPVYNRYHLRFFEYCTGKGVKSEKEHLKLVDKFFEDLDSDN